jgi:hypothetical protein
VTAHFWLVLSFFGKKSVGSFAISETMPSLTKLCWQKCGAKSCALGSIPTYPKKRRNYMFSANMRSESKRFLQKCGQKQYIFGDNVVLSKFDYVGEFRIYFDKFYKFWTLAMSITG